MGKTVSDSAVYVGKPHKSHFEVATGFLWANIHKNRLKHVKFSTLAGHEKRGIRYSYEQSSHPAPGDCFTIGENRL